MKLMLSQNFSLILATMFGTKGYGFKRNEGTPEKARRVADSNSRYRNFLSETIGCTETFLNRYWGVYLNLKPNGKLV